MFNENTNDFGVNSLTKKAIDKLNEIKEAYGDKNINPLLLVQIGNDKDENISKDEMFKLLIDNGIEEDEISFYLSGFNTMPKNIDDKTCSVRVVITKVAASTGWDCPRAKVLLAIRNTSSESFQIQTLGRICRMPEQKHYENNVLEA